MQYVLLECNARNWRSSGPVVEELPFVERSGGRAAWVCQEQRVGCLAVWLIGYVSD